MADRIDSRIDPEGRRLPIKLDTTSNGEFVPVPLSGRQPRGEPPGARTRRPRIPRSWRLDPQKRSSSPPAARRARCSPSTPPTPRPESSGGFFDLPRESALDQQLARVQVGPAKDEFIFDVQGHFIDTPKGNPKRPEVFIKDVFMDSDTDLMVLSFVPSTREAEPVTIEAADAVRRIVEKLEGTHRLLLHGRVNPNQPGDLERHGRAEGEVGRERVEDLHAVRPRRQRLLPVRRRRHALHREGARSSA